MNQLTEKQMHQEASYDFPYHYLDLLKVEELGHIEKLSCLKIVKNLIKPFNGQLILDAGCGDGRFCYELRDEKVKTVGVDFSERAIKFAGAFNPNVEFFVQDLKNLNLPYKFDYIVLIETLEHLVPESIPIILERLSNILKKDGKLIITVPSTNLLPQSRKHYQHFSEYSLRTILKNYFGIIEIIGHSKNGFCRKVFSNLRRIGILIYCFRNRIKLIKHFYRFLKNYYTRYLETCKPEEGDKLIVICKNIK